MKHEIKPLVPVKTEGLEETARALLEGKPENTPDSETSVENREDYWTISGVNYRNNICTVDLSKSLIDNGSSKNQQQWADYRSNATSSNGFYTGDMPLYHAVFSALFKQKDTNFRQTAEEARAFIQKQMREEYPMTLTRIAYQPKGKDKIIHNFGTNEKYELEENIVGPNREIIASDKKVLTAVLGSDDINEIKAVYTWINKTPTWIWRVNSKPANIDERVARFDAGSGRAGLYCGSYPGDTFASLGVRIRREAPR